MLFYYIAFGLALVYLILAIISAVTEVKPIKSAKTRNLFRRIRISLREITLFWAIVIVGIIVYISRKTGDINWLWFSLIVGAFLIGLIISLYFRIFGVQKTRKRKKRCNVVKCVNEVKTVNELPSMEESI